MERTGDTSKNMNSRDKYDDIINMPYQGSKRNKKMSMIDRAAQFSPFAALAGHGEAVKETERLTESFVELDENVKAVLDERIQIIKAELSKHPEIRITYFVPDQRKEGGSYMEIRGVVKKISEFKRILIMEDGTEIPFDHISEIDGEIFEYY